MKENIKTAEKKVITREEIFKKYGLKTVRTTHKTGSSVICSNHSPKK